MKREQIIVPPSTIIVATAIRGKFNHLKEYIPGVGFIFSDIHSVNILYDQKVAVQAV